jgi:hypothetical protein
LISTCRKIRHDLAIKDNCTCDVRYVIHRMDILPELVVDLQASSAHDAAQMALTMCFARASTLNIDEATAGIPKDANPDKLVDA